MKPIEFVVFEGDSSPNTPVYKIHEAMTKDIEIVAPEGEYQVLSYYYHKGKMVLEIERRSEKDD